MAESRRTQMTRLLFRTALVELMQEKPFHKITIKEICERADLNRATFYLHYAEQKDLLDDVVREVQEKTIAYLSGFTYTGDESAVLKEYLEYIKENAVLFRTLMGKDLNGPAKSEIITGVLREMQDKWPVFGSRRENRYIYTFIIEGSVSVIARWVESGFDMSTADLAGLIYRLCLSTNERNAAASAPA